MTSLLSRVIATVRAWVGLNDPAENRLHPSHGWLLPPPVKGLSPVPVTVPGRRQ
jgi:hypothetical protein